MTDFTVHTPRIDEEDGTDWGDTVKIQLSRTRDGERYVFLMSEESNPWAVTSTELTPEQLTLLIAYLQAGV